MADRVWPGPRLFSSIRGNRDLALTHVREARIVIGRLLDQASDLRPYAYAKKKLKDGSVLEVHAWRGNGVPRAKVRIWSPTLPVEQAEAYFVFESGLFEQTSKIVYQSPTAASYFAGPGTHYLPEDAYNYINGKLTTIPTNWAYAQWKQNFREDYTEFRSVGHKTKFSGVDFDPDGAIFYASSDYIGFGSYSVASCYTGLLRRAVQAKLARGTVALKEGGLFELFPFGIGPPFSGAEKAYKHDGLLRAPDYSYFLVRVTDSGVMSCRMTTGKEFEDIRDRLIAGTFSSTDAIKAESLLMSSLLPAMREVEEGTELDITQLIDGFSDLPTGSLVPLAYGWHFSYPPLHECCAIRHASEFFETYPDTVGSCTLFTAYKTKITFTFEQDSETGIYSVTAADATTQEGDEWKIFPDVHAIWVPDPFMGKLVSWYTKGCNLSEFSAPIYCWYQEDGYKELFVNVAYSNVTDIHIPPLGTGTGGRNSCDNAYACPVYTMLGAGGFWGISFTINSGGGNTVPSFTPGTWVLNGNPVNNTYTEHVSTMSMQRGSAQDGWRGYTVSTASAFIQACPDYFLDVTRTIDGTLCYRAGYFDGPNSPPPGDMYINTVNKSTESGSFIPYFCTSIIIPRLNSEAVASLSREAKVIATRYDYSLSVPSTTLLITALDIAWYAYPGSEGFNYTQQIKQYDELDIGFFIVGTNSAYLSSGKLGGVGPAPSNIPSPYTTIAKGVGPTQGSLQTLNIEERKYKAILYSSRGEIDLLGETDGLDWNRYFNYQSNQGTDPIGFYCKESVAGDLIYPNTDALTMQMVPVYADQESILAANTVRWIGWA